MNVGAVVAIAEVVATSAQAVAAIAQAVISVRVASDWFPHQCDRKERSLAFTGSIAMHKVFSGRDMSSS